MDLVDLAKENPKRDVAHIAWVLLATSSKSGVKRDTEGEENI